MVIAYTTLLTWKTPFASSLLTFSHIIGPTCSIWDIRLRISDHVLPLYLPGTSPNINCRLPLLSYLLKPFTAYFLKGMWTLMLPLHQFPLLLTWNPNMGICFTSFRIVHLIAHHRLAPNCRPKHDPRIWYIYHRFSIPIPLLCLSGTSQHRILAKFPINRPPLLSLFRPRVFTRPMSPPSPPIPSPAGTRLVNTHTPWPASPYAHIFHSSLRRLSQQIATGKSHAFPKFPHQELVIRVQTV